VVRENEENSFDGEGQEQRSVPYRRSLDSVDWAILAELQADARLSMAEVARRVHMSGPAVNERVRRLEDMGVITGYSAQVDLAAVGRPVRAYLRIAATSDIRRQVAKVVDETPEVMECHRGTGRECFIMKIAVTDIAHLERVIDRFTRFGEITTSIVLSSLLPNRAVEPMTAEGSRRRPSTSTTPPTSWRPSTAPPQ
jgi:Lrp/AsnC family leucine-responsive transcriptional regulator